MFWSNLHMYHLKKFSKCLVWRAIFWNEIIVNLFLNSLPLPPLPLEERWIDVSQLCWPCTKYYQGYVLRVTLLAFHYNILPQQIIPLSLHCLQSLVLLVPKPQEAAQNDFSYNWLTIKHNKSSFFRKHVVVIGILVSLAKWNEWLL